MSKNNHIKYSVVLSDFSVKLSVIITQRATEETLRYIEQYLKTLIFNNLKDRKKIRVNPLYPRHPRSNQKIENCKLCFSS